MKNKISIIALLGILNVHSIRPIESLWLKQFMQEYSNASSSRTAFMYSIFILQGLRTVGLGLISCKYFLDYHKTSNKNDLNKGISYAQRAAFLPVMDILVIGAFEIFLRCKQQ